MKIVTKDNMSLIVSKIRALITKTSQNTLNAGRLIFQTREAGKGLSSNDYTNADKLKLDKMNIIFIDIPENFPENPTEQQFVSAFGMTLRELHEKVTEGASVVVKCYTTINGSAQQVIFSANFVWDATPDYVAAYMSGWAQAQPVSMLLSQADVYTVLKADDTKPILTESDIVQTTGIGVFSVMSQKAVTDAINAGQPNLKLTGQIPTGPSVTQQQLNAIGLTATAMNNLFACKYNKVLIIEQAGVTEELFEYTWRIYVNRKELYFRYGDNFDVMQGYSIMYNSNGTFNIKLGEI